jgi:hypothetical protein
VIPTLSLVKLKYQDSVGISTLVPQSSQAKYQDSVGISTLVPHSSQTHQDSVGTSKLVPQSSVEIPILSWYLVWLD